MIKIIRLGLLSSLLIVAIVSLGGCSDDEDNEVWTSIYQWEENGDYKHLIDETAIDSFYVIHSKEDIERTFLTSSMNKYAYKKLSSVDYSKYDVLVCWTLQRQLEILSINIRADSIVVNTRSSIVGHSAQPYAHHIAVRINKTALPDDRIKYNCESPY